MTKEWWPVRNWAELTNNEELKKQIKIPIMCHCGAQANGFQPDGTPECRDCKACREWDEEEEQLKKNYGWR